MKTNLLSKFISSGGGGGLAVTGLLTILFANFSLKAEDSDGEVSGKEKEKATAPGKPTETSSEGQEVKGERPPGGDGSMFFKVFVSRSDQNGDGVIEKSEFRGGGDRFDQMDKNGNGKLDRAEIDELHRTRMADPLSMRQRIARGETRRPPLELPAETENSEKSVDPVSGELTALTPLGTRITARDAFSRLDSNEDGKVTPSEFQRSPGMFDPEKAREVVTKVDQDGDGLLSFDEFNTVFAKRHASKPAESKKSAPKPSQKVGE